MELVIKKIFTLWRIKSDNNSGLLRNSLKKVNFQEYLTNPK